MDGARLCGSDASLGQRPGGDQAAKLPEALPLTFEKNIPSTNCDETNSTHAFHKSGLNSILAHNISSQLYASLTCEDPACLKIPYLYVYYSKHTELKSFFGQRVWAPRPVYRLLNPSGYDHDSPLTLRK